MVGFGPARDIGEEPCITKVGGEGDTGGGGERRKGVHSVEGGTNLYLVLFSELRVSILYPIPLGE